MRVLTPFFPGIWLLVSTVLLKVSAHRVFCRSVPTLTKCVPVCPGPFATQPYPLIGTSGAGTHFPIYFKKRFLVNDQRDALFFMYLFIFLTLYMFRAHRAHHQERQIVSIQPPVVVTLCR